MFLTGIVPVAMGTISFAHVSSGVVLFLHCAMEMHLRHPVVHFQCQFKNMKSLATNVALTVTTILVQMGYILLYS